MKIDLSHNIKVRKANREPYFTADPHFLHANIIKHCNRPFKDSAEQTRVMVENWNNVVEEKDDIFILGDLFYRGKKSDIHSILDKLNGHKTLILGNHDYKWFDDEYLKYFERVDKQLLIQVYDWDEQRYQQIFLSHYPHLSWANAFHGAWNFYGHVHGRLDDLEDCGAILDVGVDSQRYTPQPYSQLKKQINDRTSTNKGGHS